MAFGEPMADRRQQERYTRNERMESSSVVQDLRALCRVEAHEGSHGGVQMLIL